MHPDGRRYTATASHTNDTAVLQLKAKTTISAQHLRAIQRETEPRVLAEPVDKTVLCGNTVSTRAYVKLSSENELAVLPCRTFFEKHDLTEQCATLHLSETPLLQDVLRAGDTVNVQIRLGTILSASGLELLHVNLDSRSTPELIRVVAAVTKGRAHQMCLDSC